MDHLDESEIELYASRRGDADEILRIAAHLHACDHCLDRATAMVDSGVGEQSHTRRRRHHADRLFDELRSSRRRTITVIVVALLIVLAIAVVLWLGMR